MYTITLYKVNVMNISWRWRHCMYRMGRKRVSGQTWLSQVNQTLVYQVLYNMSQSSAMVCVMPWTLMVGTM